MSIQKRFRMFAGPNGSGKSTLYERLRKDGVIHTEFYLSADSIEIKIREKMKFSFNAYHVKVTEEEFKFEALHSGVLQKHPNKTKLINALHIKSGILHIKDRASTNSYLASFLASFLAKKLFESGQSFCFETVMSHSSKIEMLRVARNLGYKTYLYYVFTDDPEINVQRVNLRKKAGGHGVERRKIITRYDRSLELLPDAIIESDVSYLVDNTLSIGKTFDIIAEIHNGRRIKTVKKDYDFKKKLPDFYRKFKDEIPK